ncbi:MAG: prepilin-type N-terminal cleavage/methylation domain-containing protein [Erysipelotrichia bacterium]|nr:prepilin-type N-terminal cleavage/methylation domain-containing protein [Erysipelotrichia bacterium]
MKQNKKGFTLVEVIVVLVIIAILIAIAFFAIMKYIDDANDAKILAQARPVLNASKAEGVKLYANGTLEQLVDDQEIHKTIMEIAEVEGQLIKIQLNEKETSSGDFIVKIQDRYIAYNDKKQSFSFLDNYEDNNVSEIVNHALVKEESVCKIIKDYFKDRKGSLDSEGPNFGNDIKQAMEQLGYDCDTYSFRIWSKNNQNTITIGTPKITMDMVGDYVEVTRYDYGTSDDFSSTPKRYSAKVKITFAKTKDRNNKEVIYPTYYLENVDWIEK